MRIAHISDLHLLALDGVVPWRLFNKRFTGWVNIRFRRGSIHRPAVLRSVVRAIRDRDDIDHVVITGDVSNLALQQEFAAVRELLTDLGRGPDDVSMVPGNHDAYTRGAYRSKRFEEYFAPYLTSDLPDATGVVDGECFPFVRLRGPVAIIGLTSAVPRAPMVASGRLGDSQRAALHALLAHDEVRSRTPVILQHHPWHNPASARERFMQGLDDADEEREVLDELASGLLLHGHLHRRVWRTIETSAGTLDAIGSTSASLVHDEAARMAGYNLYDFDSDGNLSNVESWMLTGDGSKMQETEIPRA